MKTMRSWVCLILIVMFAESWAVPALANVKAKQTNASKPRLVMVEIPSWKTTFFGLPRELPLLIKPGTDFNPKSRHYDFAEGLEAMDVFLSLRPKHASTPAFRRFLIKWPLYQKFFKAVDAETYPQAEKLLAAIKAADPKEPAVHFYLGSLNTQLKQYARAEKNYQECLKYYVDYGPAYINLARLVKARGDGPRARQYLEEAVRRLKDSDQTDAYQLARKMLESLGQ